MAINNQTVTAAVAVTPVIKPVAPTRTMASVGQIITTSISHHFNRGDCGDLISFRQVVAATLIPDPKRLLVVSSVTTGSSVLATHTKPAGNSAGVGYRISLNASRRRTLPDSIGLTQTVQYYLVKAGTNSRSQEMAACNNPQILSYYAALVAGPILLDYNSQTLQLRKPEFGDTWSFEKYRIYRTSRGLDLQVYADPIWPQTELLTMDFTYLTQIDASAYLAFLNQSLGKLIGLKDHLGRSWSGFILNPSDEVVQKGRNNFTATLAFQGVLI